MIYLKKLNIVFLYIKISLLYIKTYINLVNTIHQYILKLFQLE